MTLFITRCSEDYLYLTDLRSHKHESLLKDECCTFPHFCRMAGNDQNKPRVRLCDDTFWLLIKRAPAVLKLASFTSLFVHLCASALVGDVSLEASPGSFTIKSLSCLKACFIKCHTSGGGSTATWLNALKPGNVPAVYILRSALCLCRG